MSSPAQADEDEVEEEVEFVSEGPLRPVLECIDLLSDSEDEGCSSFTGVLEDKITRHKARVTSTLDRLAQQVALEKKERADKCRAFKEKQILQKAHGQQELAFSSANGINQEAKRCVDMWLKMPGLQPGVIGVGSGRRRRPASFPIKSSTRHTCPVINCGRIYDNASLLDGHLKRFDHSPCDPTIHLKGSPSELFACVACGQHFQTKEAWRKHLESKVSSTADAHSITQTYQRIVCFACPACYLFFNLRDECLQHMSAKNHFTEALTMHEPRGRALPVPVPQYVKNRLITLCKDTTFNVRCSLCHQVLISHQAAQAHFNVYCRQGCAVAKADKTIVQVMKQLQVQGQCSLCCKIFLSQAEIEKHKESTQHDVEVNQTMEKALLQLCRFDEIQHTQRAKEWKRLSTGLETPFEKRKQKRNDCERFPTKRQRLSPIVNGSTSRNSATAWFCECGLQFSEEATASKHLLAVNQIFHQCGVCGKHMGESSITRLHMSRFHGGAHLSNFLFYCRKCKVEMPRYEDILLHVSEAHSGHTYFTEQEVSEEDATVIDAKPSTSSVVPKHSSSKSTVQQNTVEPSSSKADQTWMCRMCEDIFDSEVAVHKHCSDVSSHSFQRFICGHCPQKFFKESTVRRHCVNEHDGQIKSSHFCGLCDSMQFESEAEFLAHYKSLHSKDYYCMDDVEVVQPTITESTSQPTCPCMGSEKSKEEMKATYTQCMRNLAAKGECQYVCAPCGVSVQSYAQIKTHVHTKHAALNLDKTFDVECKACQESFVGVPSFHKHYHSQHCTLEPCTSSRTCEKDMKAEPTTVKILNAVEIEPDNNESEDETRVKFSNICQANKESEANENASDDEMKHALSLINEEEARESAELEEALKRSLVEY
ncbi:E3 SUMO-protein ligase ZNF451 isoform X1 [Lates calcarifer]|uniref:E3 SUMO-protein ligase ZNF451 isoform X1 n=1 Tax=Lates calcarifer TaxID=8187 RepID=A0A4W6GAI8_LATCA|nr:E3 SUMO-protein ligase ZNF451 isoform X1 [Lates calcarifer]XP_018545402.1 E3 SUMO-protein ligase ZNF451 isoform X1 [Lates calcarifer]XP_018545403.1 E3 SUMO-protein ligase ZNF451 isoform X1 [Lates calcarifer]XP_018545404.1 E3 SUMO-protein ligase ZNF451 isoform X1 [Lates calcarifer]